MYAGTPIAIPIYTVLLYWTMASTGGKKSFSWLETTSFCVILLAIMYVRMYIYCDLHGQMKGSAHS